LVPVMLLPLLASPAAAGKIFGRKNRRANPDERVPQLLATVKTDGDESKRAAAAQELRQFDPQRYPLIVPVLIDVLFNDQKPGVRAEAAQSLGKMRPISQQAGMALEQALSSDASMRVRLQARSSLLQYHWSGYRSTRKDDLMSQTKEPPLAAAKAPPIISTTTDRLTPQPAAGTHTTSGYQFVPAAPAPLPTTPVAPTGKEPPLAPRPLPSGSDNGPDMTPP
jgi:hypothetical protein